MTRQQDEPGRSGAGDSRSNATLTTLLAAVASAVFAVVLAAVDLAWMLPVVLLPLWSAVIIGCHRGSGARAIDQPAIAVGLLVGSSVLAAVIALMVSTMF